MKGKQEEGDGTGAAGAGLVAGVVAGVVGAIGANGRKGLNGAHAAGRINEDVGTETAAPEADDVVVAPLDWAESTIARRSGVFVGDGGDGFGRTAIGALSTPAPERVRRRVRRGAVSFCSDEIVEM